MYNSKNIINMRPVSFLTSADYGDKIVTGVLAVNIQTQYYNAEIYFARFAIL